MKTTKYICLHCSKRFNNPIKVYQGIPGQDGSQTGIPGCPHCGYDGYTEDRVSVLKSELSQYISLSRELERDSAALCAMKSTGGNSADLEELVENSRLRCMALLLKTEQFIYSIDDSLMRSIFELRYVKGLKWSGVAANLGGYYTEDYVRIMHDRYLKNHA